MTAVIDTLLLTDLKDDRWKIIKPIEYQVFKNGPAYFAKITIPEGNITTNHYGTARLDNVIRELLQHRLYTCLEWREHLKDYVSDMWKTPNADEVKMKHHLGPDFEVIKDIHPIRECYNWHYRYTVGNGNPKNYLKVVGEWSQTEEEARKSFWTNLRKALENPIHLESFSEYIKPLKDIKPVATPPVKSDKSHYLTDLSSDKWEIIKPIPVSYSIRLPDRERFKWKLMEPKRIDTLWYTRGCGTDCLGELARKICEHLDLDEEFREQMKPWVKLKEKARYPFRDIEPVDTTVKKKPSWTDFMPLVFILACLLATLFGLARARNLDHVLQEASLEGLEIGDKVWTSNTLGRPGRFFHDQGCIKDFRLAKTESGHRFVEARVDFVRTGDRWVSSDNLSLQDERVSDSVQKYEFEGAVFDFLRGWMYGPKVTDTTNRGR